MQLFSADATIFFNRPKFFFRIANRPKISQISYFFHKNCSLHDFYIMTLVVVILFKVIFLVNSNFIVMQSSGSYQAVVRQPSNRQKSIRFVIHCTAYMAKRLFSLVISKIERGLENVASLTVYVEI